MKKIIAILMAAVMLTGFSACGSQPAEDNEPPKRVSTEPLDPAIIGTWSNGTTGYRFQEDRRVSLVIDKSDYAQFKKDDITISGQPFDKAHIDYDGISLRAFQTGTNDDGKEYETDILCMERRSNPDKSTYNGEYTITGGIVKEILVEDFASLVSKTVDEMTVDAVIEDGKFTVIISDFCWYETINGTIALFDDNMSYVDPNADSLSYNYSISGDELTMIYFSSIQGASADKEIYKKIK